MEHTDANPRPILAARDIEHVLHIAEMQMAVDVSDRRLRKSRAHVRAEHDLAARTRRLMEESRKLLARDE